MITKDKFLAMDPYRRSGAAGAFAGGRGQSASVLWYCYLDCPPDARTQAGSGFPSV